MSILKDTLLQGGLAVGNLVATERDRPAQKGSIPERAQKRVRAVVTDGATKTAVSVGAPHAAREVARRAGENLLGKVAAGLARRPLVAAGAALLAVDAVREGARVVKGQIKPSEALTRLGGHATGLVGGAGGGYAGAALGSVLIPVPVVGTLAGGLIGSVVGSVAGDLAGRTAVQKVLEVGGGQKGSEP
ncbi:MAG: hypothetical protein AB2A00_06705 [Myxococcota bacterium]